MRISRLAWLGIMLSLLPLGAARTAGAYAVGERDWASLEFQGELGGGPLSVYLDMSSWGTQYYDGVPPQNNGGLGDATVCIAVYSGSMNSSGTGCLAGDADWSIDRLMSATIDDTVLLRVTDADDQTATEPAQLEITITARGAPFPGAGVTTTPEPGAEVDWSLRRDGTVSGTITSATFGTINIAGAWATIGLDRCIATLGLDNLSCRY